MKKLYIEDCLETLKRDLTYDYVVTSPPDFDELDKAIDFSYEDFIKQFAVLLNPVGNFVSICISDRKSGGQIISKHSIVINVFKTLGYILHSHKIWVKGTGVNDYRVNYQHIMTFSRKGTKRKPVADFKPDVFIVNQSKYKSYTYGMPVRIIELLVNNYTDKNNIVYDPFMGSGTTAEACENTRRRWIGSEIDKKYGELVKERMGLGAEDL
jgi:DNA modification methylase